MLNVLGTIYPTKGVDHIIAILANDRVSEKFRCRDQNCTQNEQNECGFGEHFEDQILIFNFFLEDFQVVQNFIVDSNHLRRSLRNDCDADPVTLSQKSPLQMRSRKCNCDSDEHMSHT